METCDTLTGEGMRSCYAQFGVDAARVREWFGAVSSLEALFEATAGGGGGGGGAPGPAVGAAGRAVATLDEDEYADGGQGRGGGSSPAPWWPPLPPLWG